MRIPFSFPLRAGVVFLALAGIGGTGCVTSYLAYTHNDRMRERAFREMDKIRARRIAELTPLAQAGDPVGLTGLAYMKLEKSSSEQGDRPEAIALLERAAGQGYGQAQAVLGEFWGTGESYFGGPFGLGWEERKRHVEQGIPLLQKAATQACRFSRMEDSQAYRYGGGDGGYSGMDPIEPARQAGDALAEHGRAAEAQLWHARAVLHCKQLTMQTWKRLHKSGNQTIPTREAALALILLTAERDRIESVSKDATPDEMAAAARIAADLRRQVAESERDFPAPTHDMLP
jgi:hypothetical protein